MMEEEDLSFVIAHGLQAEIDRLRAERDKWVEYATGDRAELALKMEALRAELAEAKARIVDAQQDCADARSSLLETEEELAAMALDLTAANARIAELRADASTLDAVVHALDIEDGFLEPVEAIEGLYARAKQAEARIAELEDYAVMATLAKNNDQLRARAERAEASHEQQVIVAANYAERAERAEAAAACYARQVGSADAENANLRDAVKRAEAERDAAVKALTRLMEQPTMNPLSMTPEQRQELWAAHTEARAALAPSPAGREG